MIEDNHHTQAFTLHYCLRLGDGAVVDSTEGDAPLRLRIGDGTLHPTLERCLAGLTAGARKTFHIASEQGFGPYDPEMVRPMERSEFSDQAMLEPGTMIAFETPTGDTVPGRILSIEEQHVLIDFNHPLAGRDFEFEVHILARD
jgi:FKBP-type peptidyl-prolyl cis-trans isomerase SlpA